MTGREISHEGYGPDAQAHDLMVLAFMTRVQLERAIMQYPVCDEVIVKLVNLDGQYEELDLGKALLYLNYEYYQDDESNPFYEEFANHEGWWAEGIRNFYASDDRFIIGEALQAAFQQQKEE